MKMSKKTIILISSGVLVLALLVFAGVKLFSGVRTFSEEEKKLARSLQSMTKYYNADPFPSQENIDKENANIKTLEDWFLTLVDGIRKGQVAESNEKRPSKFIDSLTTVLNEVKKTSAERKPRVVVPEGFALGFERYSMGDLPDPKYVPRLTQQLFIMDNIANLMIESGVSEILEAKREVIEGKASKFDIVAPKSGEKRYKTSSKKGGFSTLKIDMVNEDAGSFKEGALFTKFRFIFIIRADEDALVEVLNKIAASPLFMVTTRVSLKKDKNDVVLPQDDTTEPSGAGAGVSAAVKSAPKTAGDILAQLGIPSGNTSPAPEPAEEPEAEEAPVAAMRLSRKQRMVSGPKFEEPMDILLEIDVYRFADTGGRK